MARPNKIYKILDLETNGTGDDASSYTAFKYKATTEWKSFVDSSTYLKSDADGYVTWKDTTENTADIEAFSKAAMKFAAIWLLMPLKLLTTLAL